MNGRNDRWIYTYDYAPESVWEPWRENPAPAAWIPEEADRVAARVLEHDIAGDSEQKCLTYLLLADSHFTYNGTWEDTLASMRALADRITLDGIIHLGDLTDGMLPLSQTREIEQRVITDITALEKPVYLVPGNHDYNYFRGNPEIRYPDRPQYYVDHDQAGLRLVFIDSFDPLESSRYGFTDYTIHWLEAVLRQMPDQFRAVIFSHVPPLVRLQAWTKDIRNRTKLIEVLDRHADRILAFINGHNHCDHLFNDLHNGRFPVISINCAKCEYFTDHKPEGAVIPYRELGSRLQESFDVLQIDTVRRELYFTRFGAGEDRAVREGKAVWESQR